MRAAFVLLDYIKTLVNPLVSPDAIEFHPGNWAPEGSDDTFATYEYVQNRDFSQPYIHLDNLSIKLYHTSYVKLKELVGVIQGRLNLENVHDNPALVAAGKFEGIIFHDIVVRVGSTAQNSFVESTEYYYDALDILLQYVEAPVSSSLAPTYIVA